jgi:glycosyltransferase involved in cell wall biosynthesis
MMNNPFFSVIIPTYNRAEFIGKAIDSVLAQTFQDFEIIVVDDGSTDNTEEVVQRVKTDRLRYFKKENGERAAARNFGANRATGKFVNFLDSDDLLYPNHLLVGFNFIKAHDHVQIFHLGYDVKDWKGRVLNVVDNIQFVNRKILSGNVLSCNGVFVNRECMLKNPFNEDRKLSSLEDWELWIRMSAVYPFLNSNTVTSTIFQHDERSVMTVNKSSIKTKTSIFVKYALENEGNQKAFGRSVKKVAASAWTYAALHLLMAGENKSEVIRYVTKGIATYPGELFTKRFLVIIKKLVGF